MTIFSQVFSYLYFPYTFEIFLCCTLYSSCFSVFLFVFTSFSLVSPYFSLVISSISLFFSSFSLLFRSVSIHFSSFFIIIIFFYISCLIILISRRNKKISNKIYCGFNIYSLIMIILEFLFVATIFIDKTLIENVLWVSVWFTISFLFFIIQLIWCAIL